LSIEDALCLGVVRLATGTGPTAIARQANFWQRIVALVRGPNTSSSYVLTHWLFLRLLGGIYFVAFLSWWMQSPGLIGSNGVAPIADYLAALLRQWGSSIYWQLPTLAWLNSSDNFLNLLWGAGTLLSLLVILDILTLPVLAVLWVLYLSLLYAGQVFTSFQWDILLPEVGFLAIFLAPLRVLPRLSQQEAPSRIVIWLLRLVLFRLMLESGHAKLASGDPTWRDLTALTYHYWTQPLPSPLAWYMNQLPLAFQQLSVLFMFMAELVAPFLIFGPRRIRFLAAGLMVLLQLLILLTGNYTFFNFLAIALCLLLLDDAFLSRFLPARLVSKLTAEVRPEPAYRRVVAIVLAILIGLLNVVEFGNRFFLGSVPAFPSSVAQQLEPLRLVNSYGLFATMTTSRPEIIVEGSEDGNTWLPYEFKYKPGDLYRSPAWIEPFQPRLDWQMWFAALEGSPYYEGWFPTFARRLLQGTPEVLALLDKNPFPDHPPRYIRATLYDYTFADASTHFATGQWWQRRKIQDFMQPISLDMLAK
jgi:hypothetical protein